MSDSQLPSPKLSPKMPPKLSLAHKRGHFFLFQITPAVRVTARQLRDKNCLAAIFVSRHQGVSSGPLGKEITPQCGETCPISGQRNQKRRIQSRLPLSWILSRNKCSWHRAKPHLPFISIPPSPTVHLAYHLAIVCPSFLPFLGPKAPRVCKPWFPNRGSRLAAEQRLN